ncbi:hypothetical protein Tco_1344409 [Tanacetum coccineum]
MEVPDAMISDAIKKKAGYKCYMAKKVEVRKIKSLINQKSNTYLQSKMKEEKICTMSGDRNSKVLQFEDLAVQSLLDLRKGSKASRLKSLRQKKQPVAGEGSSVLLTTNTILHQILLTVSDTSTISKIIHDREIFYKVASEYHHAKKTPYPTTTPQPNSLQAKAKKLMQKAKKNMRKINFKKAVAQKFKEYDQKLEALTNFNVSEVFEKAV